MRNRIRELRTAKRLSLQQLAELVGTSRQQIHRLETGVTRVTIDWLGRIAPHLGVDPKDLMAEIASVNRKLPDDEPDKKDFGIFRTNPVPQIERTLPVLGRARGGAEGAFHMPNEQLPVDWTFRPPQLEGVTDAYGVFVFSDSMYPKYCEGQTLWVHPGMPCKPGDGVVIIKRNDAALIKILVRRTQHVIRVLQIHPEEEFEIEQSDIRSIHRILGAIDPT
jgi:phage repressor protein C with HTH and peptisase S24 domain